MDNIIGVVVSKKNLKTVTVNVSYHAEHSKYKKSIEKNRKIKAHYENIELKIGDKVRLKASKPFSKTKRFLVLKVFEKRNIKD